MRVGIDCRELGGQVGGFRTYLQGVLEALAAVDCVNHYLLYVRSLADIHGVCVPRNSKAVAVGGGRLWTDWVGLRRRIGYNRPDVVHFPANYGLRGLRVPTVITLHDCISFEPLVGCASMKSELLRRYSAFMTRRSVMCAEVVVTVSNYSRDQIARRFGVGERVVVTHGAARINGCDTNIETVTDKAESPPYILALASVDRRKNTALVMEAFAMSQLCQRACRLVVVASHASAREMVERRAVELGIGQFLDIRSGVDDAVLQQLYRNCLAFVFSSLDEGFGLPPLEAMACGAVVLSSNRASMPEVLGDAALYFDPTDPADLARKIDMVITEKSLRERLRESGVQRAESFSWEKTARGTLNAYERAVATFCARRKC